jgi:hypothetical protein
MSVPCTFLSDCRAHLFNFIDTTSKRFPSASLEILLYAAPFASTHLLGLRGGLLPAEPQASPISKVVQPVISVLRITTPWLFVEIILQCHTVCKTTMGIGRIGMTRKSRVYIWDDLNIAGPARHAGINKFVACSWIVPSKEQINRLHVSKCIFVDEAYTFKAISVL